MQRRTWKWHSHRIGRELEVGCWGHFGTPVLLFATAAADCFDYEKFKVIEVMRPLIEAGRIKVYSCGSISRDGWLDDKASPGHKSWLQSRWDDYLVNELLPHIERDCSGARGIIASGSSLGAYNAVNAVCKHPEWFVGAIGMSGTYDFDRWMHGYRDSNYYFNQPMYFVPNLPEGPQLQALRTKRFVIATGSGRAEAPDESRRLAGVLSSRGIPVNLEVWGNDAHHDWPTWRTMLPMFLERAFALGA